MNHGPGQIGRRSQLRIAHHVNVDKSGDSESVADAAIGGFNIQKQFRRSGRRQPQKKRRYVGGGGLRMRTETIGSAVVGIE